MQLEWRKQGVGFYAVNGSVAAKGPSTGGWGGCWRPGDPESAPMMGHRAACMPWVLTGPVGKVA